MRLERRVARAARASRPWSASQCKYLMEPDRNFNFRAGMRLDALRMQRSGASNLPGG